MRGNKLKLNEDKLEGHDADTRFATWSLDGVSSLFGSTAWESFWSLWILYGLPGGSYGQRGFCSPSTGAPATTIPESVGSAYSGPCMP